MSIASRREQIAQIFLQENKVKVGELAKAMGVTTETIRKDLIVLEEQGLIRRSNGGAEVMNEQNEQSFDQKSRHCVDAKKAIGAYAASLIPQGATIFIDSGSTTYHFARQLILRKDITVVTGFIKIASLFIANHIKVVLIGGEIRQASGCATGYLATDTISKINADMAFIGTSGFGDCVAPCVENFPEAEVKKSMIQHAAKSILLTDSSKANCRSMVNFAQWSDFQEIITDDKLPPQMVSVIASQTKLTCLPTGN